MKNLTISLSRLAVVVATTLSLGACSRADYAANSRAADTPLSSATGQQPLATAPAAPYVPVAAAESAVVKVAPAAASAPLVATQPVPVVAVPAAAATAPAKAVAPAAATTQAVPKLNLAQRLALHKITKKLDKLTAQASPLKKHDASAARGGLDSNLRSALLFGLIGLIVLLFSGVNSIFAIIGTILLIVGLVFLVLWLLDQA